MSFGTIGSIIKKFNQEEKHQNDIKNSTISEETKPCNFSLVEKHQSNKDRIRYDYRRSGKTL
jgi:hypothetical protein